MPIMSGKPNISAKELITRKDLQTFHFDLEQHFNKALGYTLANYIPSLFSTSHHGI
ncbi:MAG: hypothetical protein GX365_01890 [Clostridiales bacterium]|nr:hypothetical protein [Clostridiales bacterium]